MIRQWAAGLYSALFLGLSGCAQAGSRPEYDEVLERLHRAAERDPSSVHPEEPLATALDPGPAPADLVGSQPVEVYIRRALAENRTVQAARFNVLALQARIPQVTSLDDPVVSNTIYPIPSVAPQFSLMGYMPYEVMLAQQFPWCGTLGLRGQAAEEDVKVALAELATAQLDVVSSVKRSYSDLYFNERAEQILGENRQLVTRFIRLAKERYRTSNNLQDVLRAEVILSDLDRELLTVRQSLASARADLAQQLHVSPDAEFGTLPGASLGDVPAQLDRLYRLAVAARPELKGRLAAIARDERAVELARKRYYPNVTVGVVYQDMQKTNAVTPTTASGMPNLGLFVGFNLPVYRKKLDAAVGEAQARAVADAKLYEAERDRTYREVKDYLVQAKAQREIIELFRTSILPRSEEALEVAESAYETSAIDSLTLITAWREVLQIRLQMAQVESELGKALASLERAVGVELNEHPPGSTSSDAGPSAPVPPAPSTGAPPFRPAPQPAPPGRAATSPR